MTNLQPKIVNDEQGNLLNVRCPVLDLEGLITPTRLFYGVQHFGVPDAVSANEWRLTVGGQVQQPLELDYQTLRRLPARTVRTVMECSGSDMDYFDYFQGNAARPSRANDYMWLSAGEFTGAPLAAVLHHAGLTGKAVSIRAEGWDSGIPATPFPETAPDNPFNYDKALPLEKALHPDTIVAWAQNGEPLEHLHGAPVRLIVPGWSGNWSVKWLQRLEVLDNPRKLLVPLQLLLLRRFAGRPQQGADHRHWRQVHYYLPT